MHIVRKVIIKGVCCNVKISMWQLYYEPVAKMGNLTSRRKGRGQYGYRTMDNEEPVTLRCDLCQKQWNSWSRTEFMCYICPKLHITICKACSKKMKPMNCPLCDLLLLTFKFWWISELKTGSGQYKTKNNRWKQQVT